MSTYGFLLAYLTINNSITFIQGQGKNKTNLVVYDTTTSKQTTAVDIGTAKGDGVNPVNVPIDWVPCQCTKLKCNCCIGLRLPKRNIDKKVCVQITFILNTMKLNVVIKLEKRVLVNITVSILNPPAICVPTFLPVPLFICFKVYDIVLPIASDFEGCFQLILRLMAAPIYKLQLGCVRLGAGGPSFFRQVENIESVEDYRQDIIRGDNDGISLEGAGW